MTLVRRSTGRLFFRQEDMDYYLQWMMGRQTNLGSELGECLHAARQVEDGDPQSWQRAWAAAAEEVETKAQRLLVRGHRISAREAFLRACTYHRAAIIIMSPASSKFRPTVEKMQACFRQAASLMCPPVETVSIPYQGRCLPGYFVRADGSGQRHRTLIMIGGGETFAEDLYFYIAPAGQRRGYNVLMVDLPGQGDTPYHGLTWNILDTHVQFEAIVDYALSRLDVAADRLAAYGISGGGYFLGRAATYEERVQAYVLNPPLLDFARIFQKRWTDDTNRVQGCFEAQSNWRKGIALDAPLTAAKSSDEMEALRQAALRVAWSPEELKAPTLCIAGLGEDPQWVQQARECHQRQVHTRGKLVLIPPEDGADAHCQMENLSLMSATVFDWLDEILS